MDTNLCNLVENFWMLIHTKCTNLLISDQDFRKGNFLNMFSNMITNMYATDWNHLKISTENKFK